MIAITPELLARFDRSGPRYTSYPTAVEFTTEFGPAQTAAALERSASTALPLSLYVHVPFCQAKCAYCGCTSVCAAGHDFDRYLRALEREIELVASTQPKRTVVALHFGGGTPSLLGTERFRRLLAILRERFDFAADAEIALEADPRVSPPELLSELQSLGLNRLSLGVQELDPEVQRAIGRIQPVELVAALTAHARQVGIASINYDLIYGLPRQTPERFTATLDEVVRLRPNRLAVYSFAYLPRIRPNQAILSPAELPDAPQKLALLAIAHERLGAAGYRAIGIDHFALPDDELARALDDGRLSRTFMGYTVLQASEWLGLGEAYTQNAHELDAYYAAIEAGQLATVRGLALSADDRLRAELIRDLMCRLRVDKAALGARHGVDFDHYFASELAALAEHERDGLIERRAEALLVTELGRVFARNLALVFDRYRRSSNDASFSRTV